jgi:hypothetical protein
MAERPENQEPEEELHIQRREEDVEPPPRASGAGMRDEEPALRIEPEESGMRGGLVLPMARPARAEAGALVAHGIVGGILGAVAMAIVAMAVAALVGRGFGTPLRLVAGTFYGPATMVGIGPVIVGTLFHLFTGAVFGMIFALLAGRFDPSLFWWGLFYGVVVWAIAQYLTLPLINPFMAASTPPISYLVFHLVYGGVLGSYLSQELVE